MAESNALVEKRQEFQAKQKALAEVFSNAKDGAAYDLSRKSVLEALGATDSTDAILKIKARNRELDNLGAELQAAELKEIEGSVGERERVRSTPSRGEMIHSASSESAMQAKSFGELFTQSKAYTEAYRKAGQMNVPAMIDVSIKTLMTTTAGFAPESVRSGLMVEAVSRPVQILDLIPVRPISQAVDKYMEETTRTHGALEKAEAAAYAESTFVWTERTQPVQKITDSLPVTDEQLEDEPQLASILNSRLAFG